MVMPFEMILEMNKNHGNSTELAYQSKEFSGLLRKRKFNALNFLLQLIYVLSKFLPVSGSLLVLRTIAFIYLFLPTLTLLFHLLFFF